jgi:hypothetical protein
LFRMMRTTVRSEAAGGGVEGQATSDSGKRVERQASHRKHVGNGISEETHLSGNAWGRSG